jgi:hypothetical protein
VRLELSDGRPVFGRMQQPVPECEPYERERELLDALGLTELGGLLGAVAAARVRYPLVMHPHHPPSKSPTAEVCGRQARLARGFSRTTSGGPNVRSISRGRERPAVPRVPCARAISAGDASASDAVTRAGRGGPSPVVDPSQGVR